MCELLAISANKPVGVSLSWAGFQHRGKFNCDGWGFAYGTPGQLISQRFPTSLVKDDRSQELLRCHGLKSKVFLAHVRKKVEGTIALENTQPFLDSTRKFAISATMSRCNITKRFRGAVIEELEGSTGTEILFRLLVRAARNSLKHKARIAELVSTVLAPQALPKRAAVSFAFTNASVIYVFQHGKPLFYITRRPPHTGVVRLTDPNQPGYVAELATHKGSDEIATVVASTKLTDEHWSPITERTLLCLREGAVIGSEEIS